MSDEHRVLVNDEEQYALWPRHKQVPAGWRETGCAGSREECLAFVERTWTDLRPRSVREHLAGGVAS
ncbi:MbtH family NRPS accessory protein [Micromonospora sp. HK10]|uniref:MbtH family protein n=1 Tax=Micromonospora sp. HK10 TaxID=1538294 RepID=UPI0006274314|nr:MbtH family NRPS accessory protein [Micromonospora sp. HK10]KKK07579.1 antibiotic synthesis protein MbtH [Micromonospora sp. HK10]